MPSKELLDLRALLLHRHHTEERKRPQRKALLGAVAGVCPDQANTQEKTLAIADLVREIPLARSRLLGPKTKCLAKLQEVRSPHGLLTA
jgi:hypothetical protein